MTTTKHRANLSTAGQHIAAREDFDCNGTLWGMKCGLSPYTGQLPAEHTGAIREASKAVDFYVVFSYQTPIAWFANGEWTVPAVKYSVTTSRHQSTVRRAI